MIIYLALREKIKENIVSMEHIGMELMITNPLTKEFTLEIFKIYVDHMGLISLFYD